jgi:hypothetical protein
MTGRHQETKTMASFLINTSCRILAACSTLAIVIGLQAPAASADPPKNNQTSARSQLLAAADRLLEQGGNGSISLAFGPHEAIVAVARARVLSDRDLSVRSAWLEAIGLAASKLPTPPEKEPVRVRAASALRLVEDLGRKEIAIAIACWPGGVGAQAAAGCAMVAADRAEAMRLLASAIERGEILPVGGTALRLADDTVLAVGVGAAAIPNDANRGNEPGAAPRPFAMKAEFQSQTSLAEYLGGIEVKSSRTSNGHQVSTSGWTGQLPGPFGFGCGIGGTDGGRWAWHAMAIDMADVERSERLRRKLQPDARQDLPPSIPKP